MYVASPSIYASTKPRSTSCAGWAWSIRASARAGRSGSRSSRPAGRRTGRPAKPSIRASAGTSTPTRGSWRIRNGEPYALRLDVAKSLARTGPLLWEDLRAGMISADPLSLGDVVLARKDVPTSYHLAVTVDDHLQGVTLVTRGEDLFHATHMHRLLQALLGLRTPRYYHHNLIADSSGQRLAKRNRAITLRHLRDCRHTPDDVWRMIGLTAEAGAEVC